MWKKYREVILYLFFGVCTTVINMVTYGIMYELLHIENAISTIGAWLAAVIFAFITNKRFVFRSENKNKADSIREFTSFFGCRILTGVLDVVIMVIAVDILSRNSLLWKFVSNVIVTVLNYVASKFLIFRQRD